VPREVNPMILKNLAAANIDVLKLEEIARSLESVYLQAVNHNPREDTEDVE